MYVLILLLVLFKDSVGINDPTFREKYCFEASNALSCENFKLNTNDISELHKVTNTQNVNLRSCEIQDFNAVFSNKIAPDSKYWTINDCKIGLNDKSPPHISKIERLTLNEINFIRNRNTNSLQSFKSLSAFYCTSCKFATTNAINSYFFNKEKMFEMYIERSNLVSIGKDSFSHMSNLASLFVLEAYLENVDPQCCRNLTELRVMQFRGNKLTYIDNDVFKDSKQISSIDISFNKLKRIQANMFINNRQLSDLDISNNEITIVEDNAFIGLRSLSSLKLNNNKLKSIDLYGLQRIEHLDLSYNKLKSIPDLSSFQNLKKLHLQNNELRIIYSVFFLPKSIGDVDVSNNVEILFNDEEYLKLFELNFFQMDNTKVSKLSKECENSTNCDRVVFELEWI